LERTNKNKTHKLVVTVLAECNENIYPSTYRFLIILASLPVVTVTCERLDTRFFIIIIIKIKMFQHIRYMLLQVINYS